MIINVSVIIPTYNRVKFLPACINSVLKQSIPVEEIIVVDNNSSDGTVNYIRDKFKMVRVLIERNKGVSFARNLGILNSKNNWVAFLDSDDEWMPDKIQKQIELIKRLNYKVNFIHTNEKWVRNNITLNQKKKHAKKGGYIFQDCLDICKISPSSTLIKKSLFDQYGLFNTKFKVCEDYELWLRFTSKIEIGYINEVLIKKNGGHNDQLSKKYWGIDRYRIKALEKLIVTNNLTIEYKVMAVKKLIEKINILILGAINRKNKRILKMYIYKKYIWSEYYFKIIR
jgi:glycosyltransferase involved in cell wall biosynthesis